MAVASETKIGSQNPAPYDTVLSSLTGCENLCLADVNCLEASYSSGFCILYDANLAESQLNDETNQEDKHLKKVCNIGM